MRSDSDLRILDQSQQVANCKNTENDAGNA
jgi:hypothetical protein